jgi:hypothetical protein
MKLMNEITCQIDRIRGAYGIKTVCIHKKIILIYNKLEWSLVVGSTWVGLPANI